MVSGGLLLEATTITKSFAAVHALKGVSFDLAPGEVHAIVGENGAGKSTLIKIMTGAESADQGTLTIDGQVVPDMTPAVSRALGIAAIYQQPSLFEHLSVAENIALACEQGPPWQLVDWPRRDRQAVDLLDRVGASIDPDQLAGSLSMPEQQIVEIAKAVGANARIIIMDEPTASLTDREIDRLFAVVRGLRQQRAGVIYISHRLEEVFQIADRITVLRDGETIATRPRDGLGRDEMIQLMVGRSPVEAAASLPSRRVANAGIALEVRRLSSRAAGLHDVSFTVRQGEILGVAGLVGSGRTELAETIFGLRRADSGERLVNGALVQVSSPLEAIRLGIAYLPEDRRQHGVVLDMSIEANVSAASLDAVSRRGIIDRAAERRAASDHVARLGIKAPSTGAAVGSLSGGNQQKVALARWLATVPSVLLLDEPTQGVDVASKAEIHSIITDLAESGVAIVMISSELPEILAVSDRVLVMRAGEIAGVLSREEATRPRILDLALGHQ